MTQKEFPIIKIEVMAPSPSNISRFFFPNSQSTQSSKQTQAYIIHLHKEKRLTNDRNPKNQTTKNNTIKNSSSSLPAKSPLKIITFNFLYYKKNTAHRIPWSRRRSNTEKTKVIFRFNILQIQLLKKVFLNTKFSDSNKRPFT
jgi:hypothetical protein